jgi:hypothetical protein
MRQQVCCIITYAVLYTRILHGKFKPTTHSFLLGNIHTHGILFSMLCSDLNASIHSTPPIQMGNFFSLLNQLTFSILVKLDDHRQNFNISNAHTLSLYHVGHFFATAIHQNTLYFVQKLFYVCNCRESPIHTPPFQQRTPLFVWSLYLATPKDGVKVSLQTKPFESRPVPPPSPHHPG